MILIVQSAAQLLRQKLDDLRAKAALRFRMVAKSHSITGDNQLHRRSGAEYHADVTRGRLRESILESVGRQLIDDDRERDGLLTCNIDLIGLDRQRNRPGSAEREVDLLADLVEVLADVDLLRVL